MKQLHLDDVVSHSAWAATLIATLSLDSYRRCHTWGGIHRHRPAGIDSARQTEQGAQVSIYPLVTQSQIEPIPILLETRYSCRFGV